MSQFDQREIITCILAAIADERMRQLFEKGFTTGRDDGYMQHELVNAAITYAAAEPVFFQRTSDDLSGSFWTFVRAWPWRRFAFRRGDRRSDLVKAAALIIAEIERLDRWEAAEKRAKGAGNG